MTPEAKYRRTLRHAAEKAVKRTARDLTPIAPTAQELEAAVNAEKYRNMPRGQWLNGKLYKNSQGLRKTRPGNSDLQVIAEQENHDRSVALKHTGEAQ